MKNSKPRKQFIGGCSQCGLAVVFIASKNGMQVKHDPLIEDGATVYKIHACKKSFLEREQTRKELNLS